MLTGVLSDDYIKDKCWEITAPVSLKKRVGAKSMIVAPSGNMRNSFTFQSPQPTIMNLATNILSITPKQNLPANSGIVMSIVESLVRTERLVSEMETQTMIENMEETGTQTMAETMAQMGTQTMGQTVQGMGSQTGEPQMSPIEREARRRVALMYPGGTAQVQVPAVPSRTTSTQYQPVMNPSIQTQTKIGTQEIGTQSGRIGSKGGFKIPATLGVAGIQKRQREGTARLTSSELATLIGTSSSGGA